MGLITGRFNLNGAYLVGFGYQKIHLVVMLSAF